MFHWNRVNVVKGTVALALLVVAGNAEASVLTWNTCQSSCTFSLAASDRTETGTNANKVMTFESVEDSSQILTARAFQTTSALGTGLILKARINIFTGGLGAGTEGSPQHGVDNTGPDELIVFQLPTDDYVPVSFKIGYKNTDADISTFIGGSLLGLDNVMNLFLSGAFSWNSTGGALTSTYGFTQQTFLDVNAGVSQFFTGGASGAFLIILARNEADSCGAGLCDGGEDRFKLEQVVAEAPQVAEPGTVLLLGLGLGALSLRRKR